MEEEREIYVDVLFSLTNLVKKTIKSEKEKGNIQPTIDNFKLLKIDDFEYTESGFSNMSGNLVDISEETWAKAENTVFELVKYTNEYLIAEEHLDSVLGLKKDSNGLFSFIHMLIRTHISEEDKFQDTYEKILQDYIRELKGHPIKHAATVELHGIIMGTDEIQINSQFLLKKPRKEDFEHRVYSEYIVTNSFNIPQPSAFLDIHTWGTSPIVLHDEIGKAIILLRLFRVGGVREIRYKIKTESFLPRLNGTVMTPNGHDIDFHNYIVNEDDIESLITFWNTMYPQIPSNLFGYRNNETNHISISYQHFSDALIRQSTLEQRIASAIMGMEALFLKSDERNELSYRLAIRISKVCSKIQIDSITTNNTVKDAYDIRSIFLHGDKISISKKKKIENKYISMNNLLLTILDKLRLLLIISFSIEIKKEKLIDLIDNALISVEADQQLSEIINQGIIDKIYNDIVIPSS